MDSLDARIRLGAYIQLDTVLAQQVTLFYHLTQRWSSLPSTRQTRPVVRGCPTSLSLSLTILSLPKGEGSTLLAQPGLSGSFYKECILLYSPAMQET